MLVLIIVISGNAIGSPVPFPLPCINLITQGDFVESPIYNKVYY